jgi:hypothetical protein
MTNESKKMSGILLLTVPSIVYGGYFLLSLLSGSQEYLALTDFQKSMFRAGHAHAGVLTILALLSQQMIDYCNFTSSVRWLARVSFPFATILISGGFFASAIGDNLVKPTNLVFLLYMGIVVLVVGLLLLGLGLLKPSHAKNMLD